MWRLAATVLELLSAFLVLEVGSELVLLGDVVEATLLGIEQTLLKQIRRERRTDRSRKTLFELRSECSRSELATESAAEHEYTVAITPRKHVPSEMRKRCRRWSRRLWSACQPTCLTPLRGSQLAARDVRQALQTGGATASARSGDISSAAQ